MFNGAWRLFFAPRLEQPTSAPLVSRLLLPLLTLLQCLVVPVPPVSTRKWASNGEASVATLSPRPAWKTENGCQPGVAKWTSLLSGSNLFERRAPENHPTTCLWKQVLPQSQFATSIPSEPMRRPKSPSEPARAKGAEVSRAD